MGSSRVCRLCLKLILNNTFEPLDRDKSRMLKVLFDKWDDDVIKDAIICSNCIKSIQKSYDFKKSCIVNVDHLKTDICDNAAKLYLILDKNKIKSEEQIRCQFCLNYFDKNSFIDLSIKREVPLKKMLEKCLPEMNIQITENTLMCPNCMESLQVQFDFVISCLDNEEKIRQFCSPEKHKNLINILEWIKNLELENNKNRVEIKEEHVNVGDDLLQVEELEELEIIKHELDISDDVKIHIKDENQEAVAERNEKICTQIQCPSCIYKCARKKRMEHHIRKIHENKTVFSCQLCSHKTEYKYCLKMHQLVHNKNKMLQCPGCQKGFNKKTNLDVHLLREHYNLWNLVTSKIHSCSICSYKTAQKSNLIDHINANHSKLKRYQCGHCSRTFVQKRHLNRHISSVHLNIRSFLCTGCKKAFKRKGDLYSHIISRHPKNLNLVKTVTSKILDCDHCTYKCISKTNMTRHIKTHNTDETFNSSCNI